MNSSHSIVIKTPEEIEIMREAGRILASILVELQSSLKSGQTTKEIDQITESLIIKSNVKPAFKGYRGFPGCACVSVNEEIVHGIPGDKKIYEGDLVSVDVGIIYQDFYSDSAKTFSIGKVDPKLTNLLEVTEESLSQGIAQAIVGKRLSDISHAVQKYVEANHFSVVREFVGHGIGRGLHEEPEIPNFGSPNQGPVLKPGMVFAIEPMVNLGDWQTKITNDGWTVVTKDGKHSAHFEHTVAITESGPQILTQV